MGATLRSRVTVFLPIVFGICFLIPFTLRPSLAQITFERTYGDSGFECGYSVQQTHDGGYVIAGVTSSWGAGSFDIYVIKTDSLGNTVWDAICGGTGVELGLSVQQTWAHSYTIAGWTESFGAGEEDVYLVSIDSAGNPLWDLTYGGSARDDAFSAHYTPDGRCIVVGGTHSFGSGLQDVYLISVDSLGNTLWETTIGDTGFEGGKSVCQTSDGGYAITGVTWSFGSGEGDVYMIKTDSLGNRLWEKAYGGALYEDGSSIQQTPDGGYAILATTRSFGAGGTDAYLIRTDSVGNVLWDTTYGGSNDDIGISLDQTSDGGYILVGWTWSFGAGGMDLYLIKTDSLGNTLWDITYGDTGGDLGYSVQQTSDGGYIIGGATSSFGAGGSDIYLIKTDENGLVGITEDQENRRSKIENRGLLQNHPNPFQRSTLISYSLPVPTQVTLEVYDITGRLVETLVSKRQNSGIHQVRWNRKTNPSGVYFYRLKANNFTDVKKMILVR